MHDQDVPIAAAEAEKGEAQAQEGGTHQHYGLPPDAVGKVTPQEIGHELRKGKGRGQQADIQAGLTLWYLGEGCDHGGQVWTDRVESGLFRQAQEGQEEKLPDGQRRGVPVAVAAVCMPVPSPPACPFLLGGRVGSARVGGIARGLGGLGRESMVLVGGVSSHLAEMAEKGSSAADGLAITSGVVGAREGGHGSASVE